MLTYDMTDRGGLARYDYLCRQIKEDILSGRIRAGEKLPSKRALAQHLEVAVVTVENAYAQLVAEGYVCAREKRGYFVNQLEARPVLRTDWEPPEEEREEEREEPKQFLLDLEQGSGGTEGFPFSLWAKLMRRVLTERGEYLLRATPHSGAPELRRAIASQLYRFRGIKAVPEQIVVGAGTEYLYNLLVQLLGRDRIYGMEDPGYSKAVQIYGLNGAVCLPLPVDNQGVSAETLDRQGVEILHISPNHQFPTGILTPIGRRQNLLHWAEMGKERYIIEDDYDSEFRFTGRPIPTLQSIDRSGRVIYVNTFSRTLAPSLRISYMVLPPALLKQYRENLGFYSCTVPALEQYTLADFLEGGYFESHLSRMRLRYRNQRDSVIEIIRNSPLGRNCRVLRENAGLHFLLELNTEKRDGDLKKAAFQKGIRLSFLSDYQRREGAAPAHTLVVNYPRIDLEQFRQGLELLSGLL